MAYRRPYRRSTKKRKGMKRRGNKSYGSIKRWLRSRTAQINYKRTFWLENWTLSTASTNGFWRYYNFTAASIPNFTEISTLFDRYKVNALKYTFRPRYDGFDGANSTDVTPPGITNQQGNMVHIVKDPFSNTTPAGTYTSSTLNTFMEQGNVKTYMGNRPFSVYFKPTITQTIGGSAIERCRAKWLLTQSSTVNHYGFHAFQQDVNLTGTSGQSYDVFVTVYMQASNPK